MKAFRDRRVMRNIKGTMKITYGKNGPEKPAVERQRRLPNWHGHKNNLPASATVMPTSPSQSNLLNLLTKERNAVALRLNPETRLG